MNDSVVDDENEMGLTKSTAIEKPNKNMDEKNNIRRRIQIIKHVGIVLGCLGNRFRNHNREV